MVDVRTLAAAVLGVALGLLFVASPETIVRIQTAGRMPRDRYGQYGEDGASRDDDAGAGASGGVPTRWLWIVRVVGGALLVGGLYFGWTLA